MSETSHRIRSSTNKEKHPRKKENQPAEACGEKCVGEPERMDEAMAPRGEM